MGIPLTRCPVFVFNFSGFFQTINLLVEFIAGCFSQNNLQSRVKTVFIGFFQCAHFFCEISSFRFFIFLRFRNFLLNRLLLFYRNFSLVLLGVVIGFAELVLYKFSSEISDKSQSGNNRSFLCPFFCRCRRCRNNGYGCHSSFFCPAPHFCKEPFAFFFLRGGSWFVFTVLAFSSFRGSIRWCCLCVLGFSRNNAVVFRCVCCFFLRNSDAFFNSVFHQPFLLVCSESVCKFGKIFISQHFSPQGPVDFFHGETS